MSLKFTLLLPTVFKRFKIWEGWKIEFRVSIKVDHVVSIQGFVSMETTIE